MREQLHTIPVNEAFESGDECPFCYLRRQAEQRVIRYVAGPGASYMETEVREATNRTGFCPGHMKKLYDYGNTLGSALILQTHFDRVRENLREEIEAFSLPASRGLFSGKKKTEKESPWQRIQKQLGECYICDRLDDSMARYFHTFFALLKEKEFRVKVEGCKGFCMGHFATLLQVAEEKLEKGQREWFCSTVLSLMADNLDRVKGDLDWLIAKYDYRNAGSDWKNSRDALQRTMQKLEGIYPADPPYQND